MARAGWRPRSTWVCLLLVATALAACGGGEEESGDAVEAETGRQPGAPAVTFAGEFSESTMERIELEADLAISILDDLFGVRPQWTSVTFASSRDFLERAYGEATGSKLPGRSNCFAAPQASGQVLIFITFGQCGFGYTAGDRAGSVLAHEYFHAIQHSLSRSLYNTPAWLVEGSAEYAAARFGEETGTLPYSQFRQTAVLRAASWTGTLDESGQGDSGEVSFATYVLGFLAVDWLVERVGEKALIQYFRSLPSKWQWGWERAFRDAFWDVDAFYHEFEAHRQELVAGVRTISGRVVGQGSEPVAGVTLHALDEFTTKGGVGESAADGTFSIALAQKGSYRIEVYVTDEAGGCNLAGWLADDGGFTASGEDVAYIEVDESVRGTEIRLPDLIESRPYPGSCFQ